MWPLAWLQWAGRAGERELRVTNHIPQRSSQPASPTREKKSGKQIRLREPRAWGIQGEPGVSCE